MVVKIPGFLDSQKGWDPEINSELLMAVYQDSQQ